MAIEIELIFPPSMRSNRIRWPDSSVTAMHIGMFIALDFLTAPSTSTLASSMDRRLTVSMDLILHEIGGLEVGGQRLVIGAFDGAIGREGLAHRHAQNVQGRLHGWHQAKIHPARRPDRELALQ